jgi:sterol 14-demethylase
MLDVGNEVTLYTSTRCLLGEKMRFNLSEGVRGPLSRPRGRHQRRQLLRALPAAAVDASARPGAREDGRPDQQDRRARKRRDPQVHEDILQTLVESHYADGRALTEDEITGLILTIMFAGHHTSGVTFSWIAVLLGQNPHIARRLDRGAAADPRRPHRPSPTTTSSR